MENGKLQQTLAGCIELSGKTRQSGKVSKTDTRFRPSSICFRLWKLKASTIVEFRFKVSILRILRSSDFSCKVLLDNKMHDFTFTWNKYIFNCSFTSRQLWSKLKA
ncbi:uncharacterized protein [Gossypium hirsutum]|uniref:Uncharacterized protein isoform X7 n=1 Tax=Gossypium hirsutum TaxID=3635 RepID=A0ABM3AL99_GOSHI|nr:uncharacterized protein LOC107915356 isoform X7 [Gossypium hirsutum]